ncbi:MAG: hypothetical protein ACOX24_06185 [Christensenellales bacterium]|jgi:DNA-directed RNA polymerase subunit M/transcription elongation factor TFIIS|nr:hypothetical protein [Clostridiales bacterium]
MKYCEECGVLMFDDDKKCSKCNYIVKEATSTEKEDNFQNVTKEQEVVEAEENYNISNGNVMTGNSYDNYATMYRPQEFKANYDYVLKNQKH